MLNNLTNFLNIIKGKMIKTVPADSDLIVLGTKNPNYGGGYAPSAIKYEDFKASINDQCPINLNFKEGTVGPKVSFTKPNYANPAGTKDVIIPGSLELTRGNNQGLYNAAYQQHWDAPGPYYTEWSSPFINAEYTNWAPLWDLDSRDFGTWIQAVDTPEGDQAPALQVGMPMVLRETISGRKWLIMFTSWTPQAQGGGFSYDRWEIFSSVSFGKPAYETNLYDKISDGVWLARGNNGPLYNAVSETESIVGVSPVNTRWNSIFTDSRPGYSGFDDLSNLESRVYTDFTLALDYSVGNNVLNTPLIMHDLTTDIYYKFEFTDWGSNNSGGQFQYTRTVIPQSCSVKFADGSILNTAPTGSSSTFPYVDGEGNLIMADSSNDTVEVGPGEKHHIYNFSGMLIVNDHYDGGVETWIAGGGDTICLGATNTGGGPVGSTLQISGTGYEWINDSNMVGPFTFTVIKTRNEA